MLNFRIDCLGQSSSDPQHVQLQRLSSSMNAVAFEGNFVEFNFNSIKCSKISLEIALLMNWPKQVRYITGHICMFQ